MPAYRVYDNSFSTATASPTGSSGSSGGGLQQSTAGGFVDEYGGLIQSGLSKGGFTGTGLAEGYNKAYDFATGFNGAPGTNLATGTSSSGTFGGSNIANAAYSYAGGKLANELFDNKGYSDMGGTVGAGLGGSFAVGGTAAAASMGATYGAWTGPIGALAGAVLGAALGSIMGGGTEDYRFRTYSGDLGDELSAINTDRVAQNEADTASIKTKEGDLFNTYSKNYKSGAMGAYEEYSVGTTFNWAQEINANTIDKNYASFEGAFGKYTVGHVDDIKDKGKFAKSWVDTIQQLDVGVSGLLSPEEIALAKEGLTGSVQASREWHNKAGAKLGANNMIYDRYAQIFKLAGRDDLYQELVDGMDRTTSANKENGGRADAIPLLLSMIQSRATQPTVTVSRGTTQSQRTTEPAAAPKPKYTISRPEGVIAPAVNSPYTDGKKLLRMSN